MRRRTDVEFTKAADIARYVTFPRWNETWSYLGWIGFGNLGDEAILEAQRQQFTARLQPFPLRDTRRALTVAGTLRRPGVPRVALLGGGTLIGRAEWLTRVQRHEAAAGGQRLVIWGAGVESPHFREPRDADATSPLAQWHDTLAAARFVGVRGPLSQAYLADIGIDSVVVGDPALRLGPRKPRPPEPGLVYLNMARPEATYAGTDLDSTEMGAAIAHGLAREGFRIRLFAMHPDDEPPLHRIRERVPGIEGVVPARSVSHVLEHVQTADLVVSQRLHGSVLAAALERPFISLDYRPKCLDFAQSVEMEDLNFRMVAGVEDRVVDAARRVVAGDVDLGTYRAAVRRFRGMLPPSNEVVNA